MLQVFQTAIKMNMKGRDKGSSSDKRRSSKLIWVKLSVIAGCNHANQKCLPFTSDFSSILLATDYEK